MISFLILAICQGYILSPTFFRDLKVTHVIILRSVTRAHGVIKIRAQFRTSTLSRVLNVNSFVLASRFSEFTLVVICYVIGTTYWFGTFNFGTLLIASNISFSAVVFHCALTLMFYVYGFVFAANSLLKITEVVVSVAV